MYAFIDIDSKLSGSLIDQLRNTNASLIDTPVAFDYAVPAERGLVNRSQSRKSLDWLEVSMSSVLCQL